MSAPGDIMTVRAIEGRFESQFFRWTLGGLELSDHENGSSWCVWSKWG